MMVDNRVGFVVVGGFFPNTVVAFDVDAGAGTITGNSPRDVVTGLSYISSLTVDGGKRLLVPDRKLTAPGVRVYDTFTEAEVTTSPAALRESATGLGSQLRKKKAPINTEIEGSQSLISPVFTLFRHIRKMSVLPGYTY